MQSFREFVEQAIAANALWEVMEWDVKHGPTQAQLDAFQLLTPGFHKPLKSFYFTFGTGHHDINHASLDGFYVKIMAETEGKARSLFTNKRGLFWCACYIESQYEQYIAKYNYTELPFSELTPQDGPTH